MIYLFIYILELYVILNADNQQSATNETNNCSNRDTLGHGKHLHVHVHVLGHLQIDVRIPEHCVN